MSPGYFNILVVFTWPFQNPSPSDFGPRSGRSVLPLWTKVRSTYLDFTGVAVLKSVSFVVLTFTRNDVFVISTPDMDSDGT